MDLEEQTLHYYLKVFSTTLIITIFFSSIYFLNLSNKNLIFYKNNINIKKGENIESIIYNNIKNLSFVEIQFIKAYLKLNHNINNKFIHYGDFYIDKNSKLKNFLTVISNPGNILNKITIVEGWSKKQLEEELSKHFRDFNSLPYESLIADTYFIQKNSDFNIFKKKLQNTKNNYFNKYLNNKLFNYFTIYEILIIGSILEKEGLDLEDKKKIFSVIFNRLNKKMRLQIDATVLFSITNGNYDLKRKLLLSDLKVEHPFNTYIQKGLPPGPISYVGKKTLDIVFENYETDFLFYFFNNSLNKHIFSKTYKKHKEKLNEYRSK